jgi:hypothetical protein
MTDEGTGAEVSGSGLKVSRKLLPKGFYPSFPLPPRGERVRVRGDKHSLSATIMLQGFRGICGFSGESLEFPGISA